MRRDYSRSYNRRTRTAVRSLITLEVFEQHPHKVIASIGAVFVLAYLLAALAFPHAHGRIVNGDAIQYLLVPALTRHRSGPRFFERVR